MFGYFGRLEIEHKGLDLLVGGFAHYRNSGGKGHLGIFGTGPAFERLAALIAASGTSDHVTLEGPRFGEAKFEILRTWDYLVMPSRFDGMPIAALEAALVGLPLLVSPATGLGELIERHRAGDMIRPLTAEGVAATLRRAETVTPSDWQTKSANAYRMAIAAGDWTTVAERIRALYNRP
jgi:glycosyltransferase involved in cell wall biosynthesis